ncbi:MAG: hypothetical protein CFE38_10050 [Comamonadaceae bacterium PBBC1]|nr:MAG: hypothetical protein CFE38_10050 [Comamonadaceae bacterium PBBC1]
MQTVFWMDAFLYLMLYAAIWYGLARYRSPRVVLWSVSGIASAVGLCVLGSRGWISYSLIVVLGQFLMAAGNWGRQIALRSLDGPPSERWMWWSGLANVVYLGLSYGLHFSGAPESTIVLLFYAYYSVNCADYCWSGRRIGQTHDAIGANAVYWAGWVLVSTLGLKTLALLTGWGATDLYEVTLDNFVVFAGQFMALIMLNVGFMQIYIDKHHRAKILIEKTLSREKEHSALAQEHAEDLRVLLLERDEIIRQLTLSSKSAGMGALVASFAHELNQPLTAILLHAELLQSKLFKVQQEQGLNDLPMLRSVADCIVSDTQRSADIIRKLRNLFRMSKGESTTIRMDQLVMDVIDLVQPKMQAADILLSTSFEADFRFHGDATQLQQVVLNLLNNAMDAMIEKRTRYPHLKIRGLVQEGHLVLLVEDNGKGIPVDLQDEVFSLFKTSKSQGMGVGLWLSRAIVESHGGQLDFKSDPGWGTVFTMRLPCPDVHLVS